MQQAVRRDEATPLPCGANSERDGLSRESQTNLPPLQTNPTFSHLLQSNHRLKPQHYNNYQHLTQSTNTQDHPQISYVTPQSPTPFNAIESTSTTFRVPTEPGNPGKPKNKNDNGKGMGMSRKLTKHHGVLNSAMDFHSVFTCFFSTNCI